VNTENVTRFEIIDHTQCKECQGSGIYFGGIICDECQGAGCVGREVVFWDEDKQLDVELQDDGKTLKVFIHERYS
jgi:DnaJ-class molecular chaperone